MQTWFITGASTGIGKVIAERVLAAGFRAVITARNADSVAHFAQSYPDSALAIALDVNEETQIESAVKQAVAHFGRIDVLINNAGYGLEGAIEEVSMAQARRQMETNFFGLLSLTQKVLPVMRAQKDGFIANVASVAGLRGFGGMGLYNASKFAVVGLTEALAQEAAPFGIRVSCVEPGPYRTDWAGRSLIKSETLVAKDSSSPYAALNEKIDTMLSSVNGAQPGDPTQIADVLIDAAKSPQVPLHLLFGDEAIKAWESKLVSYKDENYMRYLPHSKRTL